MNTTPENTSQKIQAMKTAIENIHKANISLADFTTFYAKFMRGKYKARIKLLKPGLNRYSYWPKNKLIDALEGSYKIIQSNEDFIYTLKGGKSIKRYISELPRRHFTSKPFTKDEFLDDSEENSTSSSPVTLGKEDIADLIIGIHCPEGDIYISSKFKTNLPEYPVIRIAYVDGLFGTMHCSIIDATHNKSIHTFGTACCWHLENIFYCYGFLVGDKNIAHFPRTTRSETDNKTFDEIEKLVMLAYTEAIKHRLDVNLTEFNNNQ
ncbi:hypothetical protein [Pelistega europaea]|uniref:Uncharacterized protein n=1 Tax=Pelistega europaea TaxID=106147 RepID=A0A7Y4LB33_9BURK|nr:hypothetical protein [Pelistega europaea]NOL49266.1 hypothetical protein [Pelistega europaea]